MVRETDFVRRQVEDLLTDHALGQQTDSCLLGRFIQSRDAAAFETLVCRYGPMVLHVCRAILHTVDDAEDVFQATFLILACRAAKIRKQSSLASFLYGIARRIAIRAKSRDSRRRTLEKEVGLMRSEVAANIRIDDDLEFVVHEELAQLPDKYRRAIVLCCLRGQTHEQAAKELNLPVGSVSRQLRRACELLRERLIGRGLTPAAAGIVIAGLAAQSQSAVPDMLIRTTIGTVGSFVAKSSLSGGTHLPAVALANDVLRTMGAYKTRVLAVFLSFIGLAACGLSLLANERPSVPKEEPPPATHALVEGRNLVLERKDVQPADAKSRFEKLALQLQMFPTGEFAFGRGNRISRLIPDTWREPWHKIHTTILADPARADDLLALLKHKDHNVRLLALAAIFEREDPKVLPQMAALMKDDEATVPEVRIFRAIFAITKDLELIDQDFQVQTVGRVATVLVESWLKPMGYAANDFEKYWAERKDRKYCAGWFLVRLYRAAQATSDFDPKRVPLIRSIRKEVDTLPAIDRDWTLLWLAAHHLHSTSAEASQAFADEKDLLEAGKRLGPDRLMDLIAGKEISSDPDLAPNERRTRGRADLILWVLKHAGRLLRPKDAEPILDLEPKLRDRTPWCALAAAELVPEKARAWLREALGRFGKQPASDSWQRAELAAGLWRIVGERESEYLADWFYGEKVDINPHTTQTEIFLTNVKGVRGPADRRLLARLVGDPRFDKLDHQSLRAVTEVINGWTKQPVVPFESLRPAWERGGWNPESPRDLRLLADWREKIKKSVAEWNPPAKKPTE